MYYLEEIQTSFPTPYDGPNFRRIYIASKNLYGRNCAIQPI